MEYRADRWELSISNAIVCVRASALAYTCPYTRTTPVQPPVDRSTARGDDDLRIGFIRMITVTPLCFAQMYSLRLEIEWYLDNDADGENPRDLQEIISRENVRYVRKSW